MLSLGQQLIHKPVLSLRTGAPVGEIIDILINPNNLKIEGWYVQDVFHKQHRLLLSQDVREILAQGFVVNDHESLSEIDELVRLKKVIQIGFELSGKPVLTKAGRKLGKITDYSFERNGFFIQKLYVGQSLLKSFSGGSLIIDRSQIIEVTKKKIVVNETTVSLKSSMPNPIKAATNPAQP